MNNSIVLTLLLLAVVAIASSQPLNGRVSTAVSEEPSEQLAALQSFCQSPHAAQFCRQFLSGGGGGGESGGQDYLDDQDIDARIEAGEEELLRVLMLHQIGRQRRELQLQEQQQQQEQPLKQDQDVQKSRLFGVLAKPLFSGLQRPFNLFPGMQVTPSVNKRKNGRAIMVIPHRFKY